jgi:hypothetical protein
MIDNVIQKIKGYFSYDVQLEVSDRHFTSHLITSLDDYFKIDFACLVTDLNRGYVKLKLRDLDDLTDEELIDICYQICEFEDEYKNQGRERCLFIIKYSYNNNEIHYNTIEHFHKNHIDYQDLIGKGLAIKKEK